MKQKSKTYIRPIVIVMIFAFITIGYAYLTSVLNINGSTLIKNPTWDVHFENVQVKDGSVTGEQVTQEPEIDSEQTTVSFHVNLKKPGDYYEFTVDAVNAGTIDAMINTFTHFDLTEDQLKYLETSVTYEDGEEIAEKQQLLAGDFAVYKIVVSFKKDLEADDLPDSPEALDLEFTVEYVQKDDTAIRRNAEKYLYDVLQNETKKGNIALQYLGSHNDSMDTSKSTKNIYYWHANDSSYNETISESNNVIFANHCWQILRTTDTGGTKLLYNGEVENNKCLDTRGTHQGYSSRNYYNIDGFYWYGSEYSYDKTNKVFQLKGNTKKINWEDLPEYDLIGMYTCLSEDENGTCDTLYLIDKEFVKSTWGGSYSQTYVIPIDTNSNYSQFGSLQYNAEAGSPAYMGYMYNTVYSNKSKNLIKNQKVLDDPQSIYPGYWYSDEISYDSTTNKYSLVNPITLKGVTTSLNSTVGKYTLLNTSEDYTSNTVYYVSALASISSMYGIKLTNGQTLDDDTDFFIFGDSYTDNGDGTYTINDYTTAHKKEWYSDYKAYKYGCWNPINENICDYVWYTMPRSPESTLYYLDTANLFKYSNEFTYEDGLYKLNDENSVTFWNNSSTDNLNLLRNAHYTCWNLSGECETISYIYSYENRSVSFYRFFYINIKDGKNINNAINEMLYNDDVNNIDSTLKTGIDAWYKNYLLKYSDYIEDNVFCNSRNINGLGGWNPNGGDNSVGFLSFYSLSSPTSLYCSRTTDMLSVSNPLGKLKYPVGLISTAEVNRLSSTGILKSSSRYWASYPHYFYISNNTAMMKTVETSGSSGFGTVSTAYGVRPVISIKYDTKYISGDGSKENPYYIKTEYDD